MSAPLNQLSVVAQHRLLTEVVDRSIDKLIARLESNRDRLGALAIERATGPIGAQYGDSSWRLSRPELGTETDAELADAIVYTGMSEWAPLVHVLLGIGEPE